MKRRCAILMIGALCGAACSSGCYYNSRGKNEQVVRLMIIDAESGQPVPDITVHRIRNPDSGFYGSTYTADSNGMVELVEAQFFDCTRQGSQLIDPLCSEFKNVDSVTGTQLTFLIEGDTRSDRLEIEMDVGNKSVGGAYGIEVVDITEPVFEIIYSGF